MEAFGKEGNTFFYEVGEEFEFQGKKYVTKTSKNKDCNKCALQKLCETGDENGEFAKYYFLCMDFERKDKKDVIFKEVKK